MELVYGIFFDIFRILRKSFKTSNFMTYVEDVIFGVTTGLFLIFMFFVFSDGELRFYIFFSIFAGGLLYFLTISKFFIKFNVCIITFFKNIFIRIVKIIIWPFRKIGILLIVKPLQMLKNKFKRIFANIKSNIFRQKIGNKRRIFNKNVENINSE